MSDIVTTNTTLFRRLNPARMRIAPVGATHAEYLYWFDQWVKIRDCVEGEYAVKAQGRRYLPAREGQDAGDYFQYLERAVFYNAVGRTLEGLFGSVFRRAPRIECPAAMTELLKKCTRDGRTFESLIEEEIAEVLEPGRVGILVDTYDDPVKAAEKGPYAATYVAENILNWSVVDDVMVAVLLLEYGPKDPLALFKSSTVEKYRLLALDEEGHYYQAVSDRVEALSGVVPLEERIYPMIRGIRMKYIPFEIFNSDCLGPWIRKPPLLSICDMNLAHYRNSGIYENALYYQGTPIYYITGPGNDPTLQLEVGPKAIWMLDEKDKPGVLNAGLTLTSLENAMEGKEAQIQSLGGKLIGQRKNAAAKSAISEDISIQGEEAILLKMVKTSSEGLTNVLKWMADFGGYDQEKCLVVVNEQFYRPKIGARELRSISALFDSGLLPDEGAYQNLKEAGFLGNDVTFEDFQKVAEEARRIRDEAAAAKAGGGEPVAPPSGA